jgi:hypothetical protein
VRSDLFRRPLEETLITDFLGGVAQVQVDLDIDVDVGTIRTGSSEERESHRPSEQQTRVPDGSSGEKALTWTAAVDDSVLVDYTRTQVLKWAAVAGMIGLVVGSRVFL